MLALFDKFRRIGREPIRPEYPPGQRMYCIGDIHGRADHGAIVVHGHSITEQPELLHNRIGIDTGAFHSGVLTALVLECHEQRLLQTDGLA